MEYLFYFLCVILLLNYCYFIVPYYSFTLIGITRKISKSNIGIVLSFQAIGGSLSTILSGKFMNQFDRIKFCTFSIINMAISNSVLGLCDIISDNTLFIVASSISRVYSGMIYGMIKTFVFSQIL